MRRPRRVEPAPPPDPGEGDGALPHARDLNGAGDVSDGERWFVYVLESLSRPMTYVGIAKDVTARLAQHGGERPGGARSTRAGRPWRVARVLGPFGSRGEAQSVEYRIKQLARADRLRPSAEDAAHG